MVEPMTSLNRLSYVALKSTSNRNYYFDLSLRRHLVDDPPARFRPWREDHVRELALLIEDLIRTHEFEVAMPGGARAR